MNTVSKQRIPSSINTMWESVVLKDGDTSPVVKLQLKCVHMISYSSDNHSMKAVQLIYVMIK